MTKEMMTNFILVCEPYMRKKPKSFGDIEDARKEGIKLLDRKDELCWKGVEDYDGLRVETLYSAGIYVGMIIFENYYEISRESHHPEPILSLRTDWKGEANKRFGSSL